MPDRRGLRFALEVVYLAALAAALAFTSLSPAAIAGLMLLGWALVAGAEWGAARTQPHFAAGFPPRWYVPAVALPPAQPLEQVLPAYPEAQRDEAPTWIASAALREELLGEWPVAIEAEDTEESIPDPWLVEELPAAPEEPEPVAEPEPEPAPGPVAVLPLAEPRRLARYHVDPFAEPERRRFGRRPELPALEVPARPTGPRPLPGAARGESA